MKELTYEPSDMPPTSFTDTRINLKRTPKRVVEWLKKSKLRENERQKGVKWEPIPPPKYIIGVDVGNRDSSAVYTVLPNPYYSPAEELTIDQIIEKYGDSFTNEQLTELRKVSNSDSLNLGDIYEVSWLTKLKYKAILIGGYWVEIGKSFKEIGKVIFK